MSLSGSLRVQPIAAREMPHVKIIIEATIKNTEHVLRILFAIVIKLHQKPGVPFLVILVKVVGKRGTKRNRLA